MSGGLAPARIAPLSELVRNQIAAGEVIERPASVVKELLENALDAGARNILVELEEGGVKLVRITDDGTGLHAGDLELAFSSHATSKLGSADDLDHIATLGFRGEALASIGSVARCRLYSRTSGQELGHEIECSGGALGPVHEKGGAAGTIVEVRDLFYNTPARRRFLKTTSTELSRCLDAVQRAALASLGVGFVATHGSRRLYDVEAGMDLRDRVRRTFGAELADNLVEVDAADGDLRVHGYVAPPRFSRRDTARQMWFLNARPVRDRVLIRCLKDAYRGFLVEGRQPVAFLHLSMDPAHVDVNVHPAKAEVRFRQDKRVFGFLVHHLRDAVRTTDMSTPGERMISMLERREARDAEAGGPTQSTFASLPSSEAPPERPTLQVREIPRPPGEAATMGDSPGIGAESTAGPVSLPAAAFEGDEDDHVRGPYLQVAKTYLLRPTDDGFEIIDQHALHERLTFEELKRDVRAGSVEIQRALVPEIVEVSRAQLEQLVPHAQALAEIGLLIEPFGPNQVALQGYPARLRRVDAEGLVRDVLDVLERRGKTPQAEDVIEEVLHSAACRSSIMAGDRLSQEEIRSLLQRARAMETDQTCPHSRPTRVRFKLEDLEKAFHRR